MSVFSKKIANFTHVIRRALSDNMRSQFHIRLLIFVFLLSVIPVRAARLEKAFEALSIHDYFQAKKLFYECQKKDQGPYAPYGLAVIFSRQDNPFFNIDSAGKYIHQSYQRYIGAAASRTLGTFVVDQAAVMSLSDSICHKMYRQLKQMHSVNAYNFFLKNFYLAPEPLKKDVVYDRDGLEFERTQEAGLSDSTRMFMRLHPRSEFYAKAALLLEKQLYREITKDGLAESYHVFLKKYPQSSMAKTAHEKLFSLYSQQKDLAGLAVFAREYPAAYQNIEAWKLLFSLSVKEFSYDELKNFVRDYPDFPLKNSILKELELYKINMYPYEQGDYFGFVDDKGRCVIRPAYDAVTGFYEGLAVVTRNDSAFFINKQNENPFNKVFSDAQVFKNGIAPVKLHGRWYFINRQGQSVSGFYEEINDLSDNVYVVKMGDKYGALDHFGQMILEPRFDKLGDFRNGMAYYTEKGSYGFVSRRGEVHKAEFEWISDFSSDHIAVIRSGGRYGLIRSDGKKILEPRYDQILRTAYPVFIVVSGPSYGFFSAEGCFLTEMSYEFLRDKLPEYYTDGHLFKLHRRSEQALVDQNGKAFIDFGQYEEVNFPHNGLIRVKQKNKYGYVDTRLNPVVPFRYQKASDFSDSLALVRVKENHVLIDTQGIEIFSTGAEIVKLSRHYYSVNDDSHALINSEAELIFAEVDHVQKINDQLLIITLNSGEIKLIYD
jgi:hypothetical protein